MFAPDTSPLTIVVSCKLEASIEDLTSERGVWPNQFEHLKKLGAFTKFTTASPSNMSELRRVEREDDLLIYFTSVQTLQHVLRWTIRPC